MLTRLLRSIAALFLCLCFAFSSTSCHWFMHSPKSPGVIVVKCAIELSTQLLIDVSNVLIAGPAGMEVLVAKYGFEMVACATQKIISGEKSGAFTPAFEPQQKQKIDENGKKWLEAKKVQFAK